MDKITITITRDCDAGGIGGTIVDEASAVLGAFANGSPILDVIGAAFAEAYGLHAVEEVPVSPMRNVSYRIRQYMTEIVGAYASKTAASQAATAASGQVIDALSKITIIDTVTESLVGPAQFPIQDQGVNNGDTND
jgi:hypothetical protein